MGGWGEAALTLEVQAEPFLAVAQHREKSFDLGWSAPANRRSLDSAFLAEPAGSGARLTIGGREQVSSWAAN